jgi:hypothetical protein
VGTQKNRENDLSKIEEVFAEGLIRNIPAFSRFFDAMGYSHGELTNYSNIARDCNELDFEINFWRTKSGLEVDFVLGAGEVAIEVKSATHVNKRDLIPLTAFIEEYSPRKALVVCNEREERVHGQIRIMPYKKFLHDLWQSKIIR